MVSFINSMRLTNAYLDTDINNHSNKIYKQKCKHGLKCNYCKRCRQYKDNPVEWCKKCKKCKKLSNYCKEFKK